GNFKIFVIGVLIGFILFCIDQIFRYIATGDLVFNYKLLEAFLFYTIYSVPLTFVNSWFFYHINHTFNNETFKKYRFLIALFGLVFLTLTSFFLVRMIHIIGIGVATFNEFIAGEDFPMYFFALLFSRVNSLFFHAFYFCKALQENKV